MEFVVLDIQQVLDQTKEGLAAAKVLDTRWQKAKARYDELIKIAEKTKDPVARQKAEGAANDFEESAVDEIEEERHKRREALLTKANPVIAALAKEKGADLVLDRGAVLHCTDELDITQTIIERLDILAKR